MLERQESWHELQTQINRGEVQAVIARAENLALLADCGVPVIHLSTEPDFNGVGSALHDVLWDQSSSSEVIRCFQYAIERHKCAAQYRHHRPYGQR